MARSAAKQGPPLWLELMAIVVVAASLAVAMNRVRPEPLPWVADFAAEARREALRQGLATIDVYGAMTMRERPGVIFLDARTAGEFATSHVAGAKNLPQEVIYGDLAAATTALGLGPDDRLVVYCGDILCDKSKELAEALRTAGFAYVTVMPDGFGAWQAAGGPTEGGAS
jgi:rhodanese-related sulfurtransferase